MIVATGFETLSSIIQYENWPKHTETDPEHKMTENRFSYFSNRPVMSIDRNAETTCIFVCDILLPYDLLFFFQFRLVIVISSSVSFTSPESVPIAMEPYGGKLSRPTRTSFNSCRLF